MIGPGFVILFELTIPPGGETAPHLLQDLGKLNLILVKSGAITFQQLRAFSVSKPVRPLSPPAACML